jgi:SAM-dependent methyltransferase
VRAALAAYGRVLRQAATGQATPVDLMTPAGQSLMRMDAAQWCGHARPGDEVLLESCTASTLDVGCGPGRLVTALASRGVPALGIDISAEAITQARSRGAAARLCDVFREVPDAGWWGHVLLADGNIGIGGDPARLLRRCARLLRSGGSLLVELGAPGSGTWRRPVVLQHNGTCSPAFWWAAVAEGDLEPIAAQAGLRVTHGTSIAGRWFAWLRPVANERRPYGSRNSHRRRLRAV